MDIFPNFSYHTKNTKFTKETHSSFLTSDSGIEKNFSTVFKVILLLYILLYILFLYIYNPPSD